MLKLAPICLYDPLGNFIEIYLEESLIFSEHDKFLIDIHIPGVGLFLNNNKSTKCIAKVKLSFSKKSYSIQKGKNIEIFDSFKSKIPLYVYHLIYSVFHKYWLNIGVYSVHAACVSKNGFATLLLGHSGFGKTTISLKLVEKYGFKLVYSDRVLLKIKKNGNITPIGGTKLITYKHSNKHIPLSILKPNAEYVDRKIQKLLSNYMQTESPKLINSIAFIRLNNIENNINTVDAFEALVVLYKFFLDILGSDALILNGKGIYEGIDLKLESKMNLLKELRKVTKKISIISVVGPLEQISGKFNSWIEKQINE